MVSVSEMLEITVVKIWKLIKFKVLLFDLVDFGRVQIDVIAIRYNCRLSHRMFQKYLAPRRMSHGGPTLIVFFSKI
jgi:hypothetical protein